MLLRRRIERIKKVGLKRGRKGRRKGRDSFYSLLDSIASMRWFFYSRS